MLVSEENSFPRSVATYILSRKGKTGVYFHRDFSWTLDYYLYGAPAEFSWINMGGMTGEKVINDINKNNNRNNYIMFYAEKDITDEMRLNMEEKGLFLNKEYEVYNRFNKKNIILYKVYKVEKKGIPA